MQSLADKAARWWFVISSVLLAVIYALFVKRGQKLNQALAETERLLLAQKLQPILERSKVSDAEASKALADYDVIKRRYPDLIAKYSLGKPSGE